jgi:hypothetical protein
MAVTFQAAGAALNTNISITTLGIVAPACAADDILIAAVMGKAATGNTISPPDGSWTEIIQDENDCTTAGDDHRFALFWKRAVGGDSGATFNFTKATDDNLLFTGVISAWRGAVTSGSPLDATAAAATKTAGAADNVSFPAFDPTETDSHIIYVAFYGNDATTFAAAMSGDTNPDCTTRFDLETANGTDGTIACTSGDTTDGSSIAARTWASNSTVDAGNSGVVFALKPAPTGNTVSPGLGQALVTGFAAAVIATANMFVAPGVGAVTATGFAPTVTASQPLTPSAGVLTASGFSPTVTASDQKIVLPGVGELTATGFAPAVTATANQFVSPALGELTATGFAPFVASGDQQNVLPGVGVLAATGFSPTVSATAHQYVEPGVGAVTATGFAPTLAVSDNQFVLSGLGEITAVGFAPTLSLSDNQFVLPGTGELTLTGYAPTVEASIDDYDALSFTITGKPRITFDLKGGSRIRSFLSAEPRITFKLTAKPQ